jgi:hypothetical protein
MISQQGNNLKWQQKAPKTNNELNIERINLLVLAENNF